MAIGAVTKYNQFGDVVFSNATRQWDDATAGNIMFYLAKDTYTPVATHTTMVNVGVAGTDYITTGDGAPIAATGVDIDSTTTPGTDYFKSDAANFGTNVTITAKYLIAVQPVTPNVPTTTDKLLWYVDLDDTGGSVSSTNSDFSIAQSANGWLSIS